MEFEVSIMVKVKAERSATAEHAKAAVTEMLCRALRAPVDRRFDWASAAVSAERYTENGKAGR